MGFHFVFAETPICNRRVQFSERCSTAGVANTATGNMQRQPPLQGVIKSQEIFAQGRLRVRCAHGICCRHLLECHML